MWAEGVGGCQSYPSLLLNPPQAWRKGIGSYLAQKLKFHFSDYLRGGFLEADWVVVPLIYRGSVLARKLLGMKEAGEGRQRG